MLQGFDWARPQVLRNAALHLDHARWSLGALCEAFGDSRIVVQRLPTLRAPLAADACFTQATTVRDYVQYMRGCKSRIGWEAEGTTAEHPLFYWSSQVLHVPPFDSLLPDVTPPALFERSRDFLSRWRLLQLLAPPLLRFIFGFRWLFAGPAGSYARLHVDPVGSAAWNACLEGRKRFVFFPPEVMHDLHLDMSDPRSTRHVFPSYLADLSVLPHRGQELLAEAGDVVYAPPRWPHFVENLTASVSVTENFVRCHRDSFRHFDEALASGEDAAATLPLPERWRLRRFRNAVALAAAWDQRSWPR